MAGETFVDFDSGLRVAVRKLREALGDDAENPRYIETIPKRGYRFLAPAPRTADPIRSPMEIGPVVAETPAGSAHSHRWVRGKAAWAAALVLVLAAGAGAFLFLAHGRRVLTAKDTVVLADFANSTGDPMFDGTLRQGLAVQLEQSPFLRVITDERMQQEYAFD